jgi:hypothetical protein
MATGLVIHISSGADRHTEILTDERVRIGNSSGADLRLRSSSLPKNQTNGYLLELVRRNGAYEVASIDTSFEVTKNSEAFSVGAEIEDGDEIRVVGSDLILQFFQFDRFLPSYPVRQRRRTSHRLLKQLQLNPQPLLGAMMPKYFYASLLANSYVRLIPALN